MRLMSRALQAIRCANVRFGILPPQSSFRWNDEQELMRRSLARTALDFFDVDRERVAIFGLEQVVEHLGRHFNLLFAAAGGSQLRLRKDQGQADRLAVDAVNQEYAAIG